MKKLIIASALSLATFGVPAIAGATAANSGNCGDISYTGADSVNTINCNDNSSITITCDNKVDVVTVNGQNAGTGSATVDKNTIGGGASSGDAGNTNNNTVNADVSCAPASTVSTTPTPTPTPSGGQGGGQVLSSNTQAPAALPNTGPSPVNKAVVASVALVASGLAVISGVVPAAIRKLF